MNQIAQFLRVLWSALGVLLGVLGLIVIISLACAFFLTALSGLFR